MALNCALVGGFNYSILQFNYAQLRTSAYFNCTQVGVRTSIQLCSIALVRSAIAHCWGVQLRTAGDERHQQHTPVQFYSCVIQLRIPVFYTYYIGERSHTTKY